MANEQISIRLSFSKDDAALVSVQKEVGDFLETLKKGLDLGIGVKLAESLLALPGQIRGAISAAVEYADNVRNMAVQTRTTASSFQAIALIATQYGAGMNQLTTAVQHMSTATEEAINGNSKMADTFVRLGINARTFSGLSVPEQLQALAAAGEKAGWSTQFLNDAADVLGKRSAPQLMGMLHAIADEGLPALEKAAAEAGAVLSDQLTNDIAKVGDQWKATGQIWKVTGGEFVELLKPMIDALDIVANKTAAFFQWTLRGFAILASDIRATIQTMNQYLHGNMGGNSLAKQLANNWDIAGAYVNAKWDPTVTNKPSGQLNPEENSKEVARLTAELQKLKAEAAEAAMTAGAKAADLAQRVVDANRAIMAYGRSHDGDVSKDPAFIQLEIARERLEKEYELAQKEADRTAKEEEAAKQRADRAAKEQADRDAHAAAMAAEIPLQEKLRDIEKDRSLITQNHLLDSVTKQQRLNENAEAYRALIAKIVELEKQRLAAAKDPLSRARIEAEIGKYQSDAQEYGRQNPVPTRAQQAASDYGTLGKPEYHFQSAGSGLIAGLQQFATGVGTIGDQIAGHARNIASTLTSSIGGALYGLETHTMSWGGAFRSVASGLVVSLVQAGNQMVANWLVTEATKTTISAGGATARGTISAGETAANILHAGIRLSVHVASEIGKTAVTVAQTAIRIAALIGESLVQVAEAAVGALSAMASIPYVGPFLAVGAMAAIFAAGSALVKGATKGFRDGGYTGDGPEDGVAGDVHFGEGVITAPRMREPGMLAALSAINRGDRLAAAANLHSAAMGSLTRRSAGLRSASDGVASGGGSVSVAFVDDRQAAIRELKNSKGRKMLVETLRSNRGQFFL